MRDAFAVHAEAVAADMNVRTGDRAAFLQLMPADLEFQATILLRKRFELVKRALPRTCRDLGEQAWPEFQRYARVCWPSGANIIAQDALGFCTHLHLTCNGVACPLERERARFVSESKRFAIRYVRTPRMTGTIRGALQVFFRNSPSRWHEWLLYVGV